MKSNNFHLRQWQKNALPGYIERFENQKIELTVAYQGTGKTLYTALCFVGAILGDESIKYLSTNEIANRFRKANTSEYFVIVFIPNRSVVDSTIEAWGSLGVRLRTCRNERLTSPSDMIKGGCDGLICCYQQAVSNGYSSIGEWTEKNALNNFIKKSPNIKICGVLDECHKLTISPKKDNTNAKYFVLNQHLFYRLHLVTGTPTKIGCSSDSQKNYNRTPFCKYSEDDDIIPDTLYTQEDAIRDGCIVKTLPLVYPIESAEVEIDGAKFALTIEDVVWYANNYSKNRPEDKQRISQIFDAFNAIYKSKKVWEPLLHLGNKQLNKTRECYSKAKGIIFTPSCESAISVHELLGDRSVLCLGKKSKPKTNSINHRFVNSEKLRSWLKENSDIVDWIVTCEALEQGFDYPDCKVQILIPRLDFLTLIKFSQIMGRINRAITGYPNLEAVCISIDYPVIVDLFNLAQDSEFGLCREIIYVNDILDLHNIKAVEKAKKKFKDFLEGKGDENSIEVNYVVMSHCANKIENREKIYSTGSLFKRNPDVIEVKSFWANLQDIVFGNDDANKQQICPPRDAGVYVARNSKTGEVLYVGSSSDLRKRLSRGRWYKENKEWIKVEGIDNIYLNWYETDDYKDREDLLKDELKPKYDKEKTRHDSIIKTDSYKLWEKMWNYGRQECGG